MKYQKIKRIKTEEYETIWHMSLLAQHDSTPFANLLHLPC